MAKSLYTRDDVERLNRHLARRLVAIRVTLGHSQPAMAKLFGESVSNYRKKEYGLVNISFGHILVWASVLGIDFREFTHGLDYPQAKPITDERRLLRNYRRMNEVDQASMQRIARLLSGEDLKARKPPVSVPVPAAPRADSSDENT